MHALFLALALLAAEPWPPLLSRSLTGCTPYGGDWTVRDGAMWVSAGAGPRLTIDGPPLTAGRVGVELLLPTRQGGPAGLALKLGEQAVGADAYNGYEVSLEPVRGTLVFGRHRHNWEPLQTVPCPVPVGQWLKLEVRFTATTLEVLVGGQSLLTYEDKEHPLPPGQVGLRTWNCDARFRNLWVQTGDQPVPFTFSETVVATPDIPDAREVPNAALPPIAFVTRSRLSAPNAVGNDLWQSKPLKPGCSVRVLDPATGTVRTLLDDPEGCIYDLNTSADAKSLLLSYKRGRDPYWHIYRLGVDGGGLRQLTSGDAYDVSPVELPDGAIVFVSTRRGGYTVCQPGPASNLYRLDADGERLRCVSMNTLSDLSPQLLPDGRVLFTRWEYVDRDLTFRQSLWTQHPDGSGYRLYFGNTIRDVGTFWQARPLPGRTDAVVATFAPHHGFPHGALGLVRTSYGPEAPRGVGFEYITKEFPQIGDHAVELSYRDPYPLTDRLYLCSYGGGGKFRLFLLDLADRKRLLYEDPEQSCFSPVALRPTVAPRLAEPPAAPDERWGTVLLSDVYRGLTGIERGRAAAIRIMEQVRKTEDLAARAYDQSPVMSYGTYYAKRCWGTVPLQPDGSAHFKVPAMREIYFQVLDDQGRELQRMTSACQLAPGEYQGCVGCHENRREAAAVGRVPLAASLPPVEPVKPDWTPDGIIDFPRVVQPVLDKYCLKCHDGADPAGGVLLCGDKTRLFSLAYDHLLGRSKSYRQHDLATGTLSPAEQAKGRPLVHFFWLLRTPTAVNAPLTTGCFASRLPGLLEGHHSGAPLPLADRQRVYAWIDANVPYYGTYANARPKSPGKRDLCSDPETGKPAAWYTTGYAPAYARRCASCHGALPEPNNHEQLWDGRLAWLDFTRPALSPALTVHLAKRAGGRGVRVPAGGQPALVFRDTDDEDYQAMLKALRQGRAALLALPEADMPGFAGARPEP